MELNALTDNIIFVIPFLLFAVLFMHIKILKRFKKNSLIIDDNPIFIHNIPSKIKIRDLEIELRKEGIYFSSQVDDFRIYQMPNTERLIIRERTTVNNNENDILMLEQSTAISQNVAKLFHLKDIPNVKTSTRHKKITEIIQLSIYLIVTFTLVKCLLNIIGSNYAMKTATLYIFIASIMYLYIKNIYIKDILGKFATPQKIVLNEVIDIASKIEELEEAGMKIAYKQDQAYIYDTDRYGKIIVELRDDSTVIIARDDIISTVARLVARKTVRPNPFAFLQKRIMKKMQYKQKEDSNTEKNENNSENNKSDK